MTNLAATETPWITGTCLCRGKRGCGETKPAAEFHWQFRHGKWTPRQLCVACRKIYDAEMYVMRKARGDWDEPRAWVMPEDARAIAAAMLAWGGLVCGSQLVANPW